jgi:hypothetical protein
MPTVVIGNNTGDDYNGVSAVHLRSANPTYNYGGYSYGYTYGRNILIKFTGLSNISSTVTVSAATLSQYRYATGDAQTVNINRLLRDWVKGTQSGADRQNDDPDSSCWNEYGSGNTWATAGGTGTGDIVATASGTLVSSGSSGYVTSGDLSADTEDFINGDVSNYGWLEQRASGASVAVRWELETSTDGRRPYLTVTYTKSGGSSHVPGIMQAMNQFNGGM